MARRHVGFLVTKYVCVQSPDCFQSTSFKPTLYLFRRPTAESLKAMKKVCKQEGEQAKASIRHQRKVAWMRIEVALRDCLGGSHLNGPKMCTLAICPTSPHGDYLITNCIMPLHTQVAMDLAKKAASEDDKFRHGKEVEALTQEFVAAIDSLVQAQEKAIADHSA